MGASHLCSVCHLLPQTPVSSQPTLRLFGTFHHTELPSPALPVVISDLDFTLFGFASPQEILPWRARGRVQRWGAQLACVKPQVPPEHHKKRCNQTTKYPLGFSLYRQFSCLYIIHLSIINLQCPLSHILRFYTHVDRHTCSLQYFLLRHYDILL